MVESDGSPGPDGTVNSRQPISSGNGDENTSTELNNLCRTALSNGDTITKENVPDSDRVYRDDLSCSALQLEKEQKNVDISDKRSGIIIQVAVGERVANSDASPAIGAENSHGRTGSEMMSGQ